MTAASAIKEAGTSVRGPAPGQGARQQGWPPRVSPRMLASLLPTVLVNLAAPPLAYAWVRPHMASSAAALLAAMAIPAGWTLATFAWRRRASRLGLLSVAGLGAALVASYLTGGSTLALELQDPAETGAIGLACMVSVIAGRPLYLIALRLMARRNAQAARMLADPAIRRSATVQTVIIGAILLTHAIAITILALTLPTATFLAVYRPVGLPIIAAGLTILIWYRRSRRARTPQDPTPQAAGADDDQPS